MGERVRFLILLPLLTGIVLSCSNGDLFPSNASDQHEIKFKNVAEGGILKSGQALIITIYTFETEVKPTKLEITLSALTPSTIIAQQTLNSPALESDITIQVPELETGEYALLVKLFDGETLLKQEKRTFFYAQGSYLVGGIESSPPVIFPGSVVNLKAVFASPAGADPYFRWKMENTIIHSGILSEGGDSIEWEAPKEEGIYPITVELFPVAPAPGGTFSFSSSSLMTTELYVSKTYKSSRYDLLPESAYFALFHLNGTLENSGSSQKNGALKAETLGNPKVVLAHEELCYRFNRTDGIVFPAALLPSDDKGLLSFTLSLNIRLESLEKGDRFLKIQSDDQTLSLELFVDDTLSPAAYLSLGGAELWVPYPGQGLVPDKSYHLALSFAVETSKEKKRISALWFVDGKAGPISSGDFDQKPLSGLGTTTITGFQGTITEFGVYYQDKNGRNSPDPDIYYREAKYTYANNLLYANGFDAPAWLSAQASVVFDRQHQGFLQLKSLGEFVLPKIQSDLLEDNKIKISLGVQGKPLAQLAWEGKELLLSCRTDFTDSTEYLLIIEIDKQNTSVLLQEPGKTAALLLQIKTPHDYAGWLTLHLLNPAQNPLFVNSILALSETK